MKYLLPFFLITVLVISCDQKPEQTTAPTQAKSESEPEKQLVNKQFGYSLTYPGNWKLKRQPDDSNIFLSGLISENESFKVEGTFGVRVFTFDKDYTTQEAYKANITNLAQDPVLDGFEIESEETVKLDGKETVRVIYAGGNGARRSVTLQYYSSIGKRLYILTGTLNGVEPMETEKVYTKIAGSIRFQ